MYTWKVKLIASVIHTGMSDYWSGNSRRWDADAGCLFASVYSPKMTYREMLDALIEDYHNVGYDCDFIDPMWEAMSDNDLKEALYQLSSSEDLDTPVLPDMEEPGEDDCEFPQIIVLLEMKVVVDFYRGKTITYTGEEFFDELGQPNPHRL